MVNGSECGTIPGAYALNELYRSNKIAQCGALSAGQALAATARDQTQLAHMGIFVVGDVRNEDDKNVPLGSLSGAFNAQRAGTANVCGLRPVIDQFREKI